MTLNFKLRTMIASSRICTRCSKTNNHRVALLTASLQRMRRETCSERKARFLICGRCKRTSLKGRHNRLQKPEECSTNLMLQKLGVQLGTLFKRSGWAMTKWLSKQRSASPGYPAKIRRTPLHIPRTSMPRCCIWRANSIEITWRSIAACRLREKLKCDVSGKKCTEARPNLSLMLSCS